MNIPSHSRDYGSNICLIYGDVNDDERVFERQVPKDTI